MKRHSDEDLDKALAAIREENIDDAAVEQAARRVHSSLGFEAAAPEPERIRTCDDFRALIPAYLGRTLPEARALLVRDHVHECVACRRSLETARGQVRAMPLARRAPRTGNAGRWAIAAALVLATATGTAIMLPPPAGARATIASANGALYRVSATGVETLAPGRELGERDHVRTGRSGAVLRLTDGSLVEMSERTELEVSRGWFGSEIRLNRGNVIVEAAKQHWGSRLTVTTADAWVTVKGTVFEVSESAKGSRVSVVEGEVRVDQSRQSKFLHKGEQTTTNAAMSPTSVADEVAWSRNSAKYLAVLGELHLLSNRIEALPGQGLRRQSKLSAYVPEDAVLYVAIPNAGRTLADAGALLRERLQESAPLREWWSERDSGRFEQLMDKVKSISDYVGDEIVFTLGTGGKTPLVLAEVRKPGLSGFLTAQASGSANAEAELRRVLIEKNGVVAISPDTEMLGRVSQRLDGAGAGAFQQTPFWAAIAPSYRSGAGWLLCADMEQILRGNVPHPEIAQKSGIEDVRYLIIERKDVEGQSEDRATLSFAAERHGIPSWLGAPGPVGSLDFFSPDSTVASAIVLKNPKALMEDLFGMLAQQEPEFQTRLQEVESKLGIRIIDDLAASLGSDAAFGVDGPMLPKPSVKFAIEVYNPGRVEWAIERVVEAVNREKADTVALASEQAGSRTFYSIRSSQAPVELHYTFADGYLIAGPSRDLVERAIQNRQTGFTLARSNAFREQLPRDRYSNFSAVLYQNLVSSVAPVVETLSASGAMSAEQRQSAQALISDQRPGLLFGYGEPDRIVLASRGGVFGLHLDQILAMQAGKLQGVMAHHQERTKRQ